MRIGILTLNSKSYNYGGLLQEYALMKCVQELGYQAEIIDYDVFSEANTFSYKRNLKYLSVNKITKKILRKIRGNKIKSTTLTQSSCMLFDEFRKKYLIFSKQYNYKNISQLASVYDCFICGSDQIWNPSCNIPSFFLNFVSENRNRIIYAASIGISKLTNIEKKVYKKLLNEVDYVSVREHSAWELVQPLTEKEVKLVLDPTLLLKKEDWTSIINVKSEYKPYVFYYFLDMNDDKVEAARAFALSNNLQIISTPFKNQQYPEEFFPTYGDGIGPKEFLQLINGACLVLTDSFHASVFSIIFGKQFRVFTRHSGKTDMNSRIHTLLSYIACPHFLITPQELCDVVIDTENTYRMDTLNRQKEESLKWLLNAIEEK